MTFYGKNIFCFYLKQKKPKIMREKKLHFGQTISSLKDNKFARSLNIKILQYIDSSQHIKNEIINKLENHIYITL